jgi:hypothetical protein
LPGTAYHFRVVAENAAGPSYGADQTFTTAALLGPALPIIIPATPPSITNATQSHRVWRTGNALASIARRRPPVGTTFSFTLNEQARVNLVFAHQVTGRRVGSQCVDQTKANRQRRACTRILTPGSLSFRGHPGVNKVSFQGRVARRNKLKPGNYTLVITATNAAGQRATPRRLRFTIVK